MCIHYFYWLQCYLQSILKCCMFYHNKLLAVIPLKFKLFILFKSKFQSGCALSCNSLVAKTCKQNSRFLCSGIGILKYWSSSKLGTIFSYLMFHSYLIMGNFLARNSSTAFNGAYGLTPRSKINQKTLANADEEKSRFIQKDLAESNWMQSSNKG